MRAAPKFHAGQRRRPLRERAWWCMREMAAFSLDELLLTVADGSERSAADNLKRYLRTLTRYGVVTHLRTQGNAYRLAKDLGPAAPVVRRRRADLLDANTGTPLQLPTGDAL